VDYATGASRYGTAVITIILSKLKLLPHNIIYALHMHIYALILYNNYTGRSSFRDCRNALFYTIFIPKTEFSNCTRVGIG